jgi:hypothetical protein
VPFAKQLQANYNWPMGRDRYRRIEMFRQALLSEACQIPEGAGPSEVARSQSRRGAARLNPFRGGRAVAPAQPAEQAVAPVRTQFNQFLSASGATAVTAVEHERWFQDFLKWNQPRERR